MASKISVPNSVFLKSSSRADHSFDEKEATEGRESLISTIGNLTLLTKELYPSVSNGPWYKKREVILKYSLLNLSRTLPEAWDEPVIKKRTEVLLQVAKGIWKRHATPAVSTAQS